MVTPVVHDLVELSGRAVTELTFRAEFEGQPWVGESLAQFPWVVVRRFAPTDDDRASVGVRGDSRYRRWGSEVRTTDCLRVLTPADLRGRSAAGATRDLPAFTALELLREEMPEGDWGPGGSVGAELAYGIAAVTSDSDLDVVIRLDGIPAEAQVAEFSTALREVADRTGVRTDALVETPLGGIHLDELAGSGSSVIARTAGGPALVTVAGSRS